jgi:hypothetical protein
VGAVCRLRQVVAFRFVAVPFFPLLEAETPGDFLVGVVPFLALAVADFFFVLDAVDFFAGALFAAVAPSALQASTTIASIAAQLNRFFIRKKLV